MITNYKLDYKKAKENALRIYDDFLDIVKEAGMADDDTSLKALEAQAKKIKEDRFCLMIAGEAKSGKSTFINAYLGAEILPMDVRQCTSSVVEIRYGTKFVLHAKYADGRFEDVDGDEAIKDFLTKHAALDDEYRDIPVTTINNEIIVKYKDKKIYNKIIEDLLEGVKEENIHKLPEEDYNRKIKEYIVKMQPHWKDVVVKIEIEYPFEDKDMRGISIVDSPGVNAAGKVEDVTARYIESADAIMFLRPITGVAIEASGFKTFLESKSVDRNKNTLFLILTRAAAEPDETKERAYEEFVNIFGEQKIDTRHGIIKEQIIPVDSKAELYFNRFRGMQTQEIENAIREMDAAKKSEIFLKLAWLEAYGKKEVFLEKLKKYSNFAAIDNALNQFGRKAQFIALSELLGRMLRVYDKVACILEGNIEAYALKAQDPIGLGKRINEIQGQLADIEIRINAKVDDIITKYGSIRSGIIHESAEEAMVSYKEAIERINGTDDSSLEQLEKLSFRQVDMFIKFEDNLQKKIEAECNEELKVILSEENEIKYVVLEPDFSKEVVESIKSKMKKESNESYTYTTGITFEKTHTGSRFSQKKYFHNVKNSILDRVEIIKNQAVRDLSQFVKETVRKYVDELAKNADRVRSELTKIQNEKKDADEIAQIIENLRKLQSAVQQNEKEVQEVKGGIDCGM